METLIFYFLLGIGIVMLPKYIRNRCSNYKAASGNSFFKILFDRGNYGEFLIFSYLEKLDGHYKLMTNLYIPKKDGSTTEIDLIMLPKPVFMYLNQRTTVDGFLVMRKVRIGYRLFKVSRRIAFLTLYARINSHDFLLATRI